MLQQILAQLRPEGITLCRPVPLADCRITRPYLLEREGITTGTVFMFAIPYLTQEATENTNLSAYAVPRDYHIFLAELSARLLPKLQKQSPEYRFALFGDHSPIDELHAAAISGLGVLGENRMLITEPHSSFVFLAEIITDHTLDCHAIEPRHCIDCGRCKQACSFLRSGTGECLSALSQVKGTLTVVQEDALYAGGSVWGCDRCQTVCPYTEAARRKGTLYTEIPFFQEETIPHLTSELISAMPDAEFSQRAFAWRGKQTILRNLQLFESRKQSRKEE